MMYNAFTLSLPAQNLPLSQILPTIGPLSFSQTDTMDPGWQWLLTVYFCISGLVPVPFGRLSWFLLPFDCTLIPLILTGYLLTSVL